MKVSIITVVYNNKYYIEECINSVLGQTYKNLEFIVIDGGSTDGTIEIVNKYENKLSKFISEPDNGIYDAMNKGIRLSSGNIIGILNSDDFYVDNDVISTVVAEFNTKKVDSVYGDLVYVKEDDTNKIVRYYNSSHCTPDKFAYGWMPAHPTFFVKRTCYEEYGFFKTNYKIASDFELLCRFLGKHRISYSYIPKVLIKMRVGGLSTRTWRSNLILNKEIVRACAENAIKTSYFMVYSKYLTKIFQLFHRPR